MTERTGVSVSGSAASAPGPAFPGATGVTLLEVYDWPTPDGLRGGSAHVHLASTEGYVVLSGSGRLQTLGEHGYAEAGLSPGDCLWFPPGTIHRLVNDGGLRILVVMQNAGLPEDGDAVLTFPPDVLADPDAYARAASLSGGPAAEDEARRRRDLAITGYLALRESVLDRGPVALEGFYAAAMTLVSGRVDGWRERWRDGALAVASSTGVHLDEIAGGVLGHLAGGGVWRIPAPTGPSSYGMCGRLTTYPASRAVRAG
jgi:mannose-6-phosphate isomerase-like protein (cupin superfamily)